MTEVVDVARQPADRKHHPRSFEWRGREQVVSERIRHAEQLQRQRWIVRSKLSVKHVGIYLRVSTNGQTTENQRRELETVAARSGWQVVGIYEDAGISGAKGRDQRPGFDRMLKDATARKINMIAAWSVDRLGRSLQDLVAS